MSKAEVLVLRVIADRLDNGESSASQYPTRRLNICGLACFRWMRGLWPKDLRLHLQRCRMVSRESCVSVLQDAYERDLAPGVKRVVLP